MCRRVVVDDRPVPPLADHFPVQHQHSADRHFAIERGTLRQLECTPHEINIPGRIHLRRHHFPRRPRTYRVTKIAAQTGNSTAALYLFELGMPTTETNRTRHPAPGCAS